MDPIRPLQPDDPAIGGKARSIARLRGLGLRVPAGFAIAAGVGRGLAAGRPPPPRALRSAADLEALEAARVALAAAALPPGVARALEAALDALNPMGDPDVRFAVRSSAPEEDSANGASPGLFESVLNVARHEVAGAVSRVLASSLAPAAFTARGAGDERALAVLVHGFVAGTAHGAAAAGRAPDGVVADLRIDTQSGALTDGARAQIERALAAIVERFGPSEIEWTADGDEVTYLQLRPWHRGPRDRPLERRQDERAAGAPDGWTWDAAHNPEPLSPAQAGLVALVDERAATGLRQRVIDGYLCFRPRAPGDGDGPAPGVPPAPEDSPRVLLDRLSSDVESALAALGPAPPVAEALELYVRAYQRLFGVIQPACAAARAALVRALGAVEPDPSGAARALTEGVPSAATRRAQLARDLARAPSPAARQIALDAYLAAFGDESARWDVAFPTLRETPERLLLLGATSTSGPPSPKVGPTPEARARDLAARLPPTSGSAFEGVLATAREAAAAAEDDDALFARLQALVRRALLALGQRLCDARRVAAPDDVFFLPLDLARALDAPPGRARAAGSPAPERDLRAQVAAARRAWSAAATAPPWSRVPGSAAGARADGAAAPPPPLVRGQVGAPGRAIGHVVHHPSSSLTPPRLDHAAVLVASTLLPTELPLLDAAAIVVETGTILGHVSAQARERGIPAVVAARGARAALPEGTLVLVDGDRGEVLRLDEPGG